MLTPEENDLLTRVSPGTPMGDVFRRFWLPALLASELPEADGPPVRVRLLGEDLVAFRDSAGRVGLLAAHCAHRGASLFFGRNEENGLRCVYHGWKYDLAGRCVDMPNEPEPFAGDQVDADAQAGATPVGAAPRRFKDKIHLGAYPCEERGGIIWAYLGPSSSRPPDLPSLEWTGIPSSHRYVHKRFQRCSYLQNLEGEVDSSHISFLHRRVSPDVTLAGQRLLARTRNTAPRFEVKTTDYGLLIGASRDWDERSAYWRITQFLAPSYTMIPAEPGHPISFTAAIPADDQTMWGYTVSWRPDRPLDAEDVGRIEAWTGIYAEVDRRTFLPVANQENDYLIDRQLQRTESFTGIRGIREQDMAVQEGMGPIYDRSREHLGSADAAVIGVRQYLLRAVRDLQNGIDPGAARDPQAYAVRPAAVVLGRGIAFEDGAREALAATQTLASST